MKLKHFFSLIGLLGMGFGFAQKPPEEVKSKFTAEVLGQKVVSLDGRKVPISEVLKKHEGKILIIDFWASWCKDCILALPKTDELKKAHPEVDFVYFSLDRSDAQWKRGLEKYNIKQFENYWFDEGWKNKFNNYMELNWVPRFVVVDQTGNIAKYYAISPEDPELLETVERLKQASY
ncbi:TlpA family protein disulfide reductase [Bergeyella sp. RCAD1439]|uniref:TlpA family protein disulfide reductase n=1 Tax=Bergeyella anatis TaxID=3113737 RepID=UPI002E1829DC|nr:thioredoxin-like domain-containing protein [Bergeyella sp. RCAD1439]